jgi:hypothetical protein
VGSKGVSTAAVLYIKHTKASEKVMKEIFILKIKYEKELKK